MHVSYRVKIYLNCYAIVRAMTRDTIYPIVYRVYLFSTGMNLLNCYMIKIPFL